MFEKLKCFLHARRFRGYRPQPVTLRTVSDWVDQFPPDERRNLPTLLGHIKYVTESETCKILVELNTALLARLEQAGISSKKVIYIQVDDAGSSSPAMLNLLRDAARLERIGCRFLDSKNVRGLYDATNELEEGAIIYVDDFAGTGNQFCKSRDFVIQYTVGNFAEFFLTPYICEEAIAELEIRGVEPVNQGIHRIGDRPLRPESTLLPAHDRQQLTELCSRIDGKFGLGYRNLASMIVFYRNAPNSVPLVIRGSLNQQPYVGILPRTTDLPPFPSRS